MKRFIQTRFFILIKQNENVLLPYLEIEYDEFVSFLFAEHTVMEKVAYRSALIYTQEELVSLSKILEKKLY